MAEIQECSSIAANAAKVVEPKDSATIDYEKGKEYLGIGDLGMAANAFHNAFIEHEQNNNQEGMANCDDRMGDVCMAKNEYEMAISQYKKSLEIIKKIEDIDSEISLRKKMAQCNRELAQFDKAIQIYLILFDLYSGMRNVKATVETIIALAEVYEANNDLGKAADAYRSVAAIHANFSHKNYAQKLLDKAEAIEAKG
ncbi:MAG: tetratricopeptide repeat protein [Deltaproteobacteria bacterium]|nr:tetratricopeptide repeat protein [Deltaproteobacteria bacterium]